MQIDTSNPPGNEVRLVGWHSDVERLPEASLHQFVQFMGRAVIEIAVKK